MMTTSTLDKPIAATNRFPDPPRGKERITYTEYILRERSSDIKHAFVDGLTEPVWGMIGNVMAGASYEHIVICKNLTFIFEQVLDETKCQPLGSDMRVEVSKGSRYYYPDLTVICGDPKITPDECLQNPILIAEVLSDSTALSDRGDKFRDYRAIPTLDHYILVDQYRPLIEHYERQTDGRWLIAGEYGALDETVQITIAEKTVVIPVAKIYRYLSFPETVSIGAVE